MCIRDSECCLIKLLPYFLFEKYINFLPLEMASLGTGTVAALSLPMSHGRLDEDRQAADAVSVRGPGILA